MIVPPIPVAVAEMRMSIFLNAPPTNTTIIMIPVTIGGSFMDNAVVSIHIIAV